MDDYGNLLSYHTFVDRYKLKCTKTQLNAVMKAIPPAIIVLLKGVLTYSRIIPKQCSLVISGCDFVDLNSKFIGLL